eukprot:9914417-Alexandrium_andersonii.AAC.1
MPTGPNDPIRASETAKAGEPPTALQSARGTTAKRKRHRAKRGASCSWTCGMGVSDSRRCGA